MSTPQPRADAALAIPTVPVICDKCRAEGSAGDAAFAEVADIFNFTPVPRSGQVNAWSPEHQRAFIAALAITGSAARAARAIGRHARGVEKLRKARGGKQFADAWDAALDIAREREVARLKDDVAELAQQEEAARARYEPQPIAPWQAASSEARFEAPWGSPEAIEEEERFQEEQEEARQRIRERLLNARRLFLRIICGNGEMQAAWETLVGPVDWDKAQKLEPQDDEPFTVMMRKPDMLLPVEWGLLPDITGGPDGMAEVKEIWRRQAEERAREGGEG